MIVFENVSLESGKNEILKNVSFRCGKGKITSIIGRNGAGKTSAIKCLFGLSNYSGTICLDGTDIKNIRPIERAKKIAYLPQTLKDVPFTVYELASLGRRPYQNRISSLKERDRNEIENALALTGMNTFSERRIDTLSGGERQRAYLSMILAQNTEAIVLDEPATFMDASVEKDFYALLFRLSSELGKTVVQVMHNLTRAVGESDRIVIMDAGRVIMDADAEKVKNSTIIEEIFSVKKGEFVTQDGEKKIAYL